MKDGYNKVHADTDCIRTDNVECGIFSLTYKLIKRQNLDHELYVKYVFDLLVIKRQTGKETYESAVIPAVSSIPERALDMYECMLRNTVTPMCVAEFFEEYHSR